MSGFGFEVGVLKDDHDYPARQDSNDLRVMSADLRQWLS